MSELSLDQLEMLSDHQIEYDTLTDDVLAHLARGHDLFVATSALTELSIRQSPLAVSIARDIVDKRLGDHFLIATALDKLFKFDQDAAVDAIARLAAEAHPKLLGSMLEIIEENESAFQNPEGRAATEAVARRLKDVPADQLGDEHLNRDAFLARYG
jgi:hypothetical protein